MDITIRSVRVTHHQPPPYDRPIHDATCGPFPTFNPSLLRLRTDDGYEGLSLTTYIESRVLRSVVAPLLLGMPLDRWAETRERVFWALRYVGHDGLGMNVLSSVDVAVHDILAKWERRPIWQREDGASVPRVETYATAGWVNESDDELIASMLALVDRGFTTVKMKVGVDGGRSPDRDVERVRLVRDALGPDVALAVDANQCWTVDTALDVARRIAEYQIAWFEEPVFAFDRKAAIRFKAESSIPLASGESEHLPVAFGDLIEREGVDLVQVQPFCCGGVSGFHGVADIAQRAGRICMTTGPSFFTASLAAAARPPLLCEYVVPAMDTLADYFAQRPRLDNGVFHLGEDPGFGLTLDEEYLRTHPGNTGWERDA